MAYMFVAPTDRETPMTVPEPHPGNRLMRHFGTHTCGRHVYIASGVASSTQPVGGTIVDRTFLGGHEPEEVTAGEKTILEAAGFEVVDTAALFAEAVVLLTPPGSYTPGTVWANTGAGGATFDAAVGAQQATFLSATTPGGPGFLAPAADPDHGHVDNEDPWVIAGTGACDWADDDEVTVLMGFTPLNVRVGSMRYLRKYSEASLPQSPAGVVLEDVHGSGGWIVAGYDGSAFCGYVTSMVDGRQVVGFRQSDGMFESIRGGVVMGGTAVPGDISDSTSWVIGPGQVTHSFAFWGRALTANEIEIASGLL